MFYYKFNVDNDETLYKFETQPTDLELASILDDLIMNSVCASYDEVDIGNYDEDDFIEI